MESFTFVKLEDSNNTLLTQLLACRVCLETESKLFDLHLYGLADIFGELTGTQVSRTDGLPQHICNICYVQLRKSSAFRAKCRQVHVLLQDARVRQPLLSTSHLRTLDRSQFKQQFSSTNALIISIPVTDPNKHERTQTYANMDFQKVFIDQIEQITEPTHSTETMKTEAFVYYDNTILNNEFYNQFDADITLDDLETSQSIESIDEAKDTIINDTYNIIDHEVLEEINTEDANAEFERETKKKTPLKRKKELEKKVKEKRLYNEKFVEDFAELNQMYNCETVFKTKEQQLKEVELRKESAAFKKARFQCMICFKGFMNNIAHEKHMIMHDKVHKKIRPHKCHLCDKAYTTPSDVKKHIRSFHMKKPLGKE